jgi:glycosyltransferase involved in cell wall biosynthesis
MFASADLFVFPSTTDTFGNVILEAQASGVPVLVTDQGGPKENMTPGETGIVVHGDDEDAFLKGILKMLNDREALRTMGAAARLYAEKRSFKGIFQESWEFYKQAENNSANSFSNDKNFQQGKLAATAFGALRWL